MSKRDYGREPNNVYLKKQVEKLNLRFPIAMLSEKIGYGKGNISNFLSGAKPVSDKFIAAFNKAYDLDTVNTLVVSEMRDIRNKLELTQEELGVELGVTGKTIQGYESGAYPIPESKMKLLHLILADRTKGEKTIEDMIVERVLGAIEPMLKDMVENVARSNNQTELNNLQDEIKGFMSQVDMKFNLVNENILSILRLRMGDSSNGDDVNNRDAG